jgi:hypothetical protein
VAEPSLEHFNLFILQQIDGRGSRNRNTSAGQIPVDVACAEKNEILESFKRLMPSAKRSTAAQGRISL